MFSMLMMIFKNECGERGDSNRDRPRMMSCKHLSTEKTKDQERKSWEQGDSTEGYHAQSVSSMFHKD